MEPRSASERLIIVPRERLTRIAVAKKKQRTTSLGGNRRTPVKRVKKYRYDIEQGSRGLHQYCISPEAIKWKRKRRSQGNSLVGKAPVSSQYMKGRRVALA